MSNHSQPEQSSFFVWSIWEFWNCCFYFSLYFLAHQGTLVPCLFLQKEWKIRWESFPSKLTEALVKYHVIVLVMRLYEHIASKVVDTFTLDSLTLDTFAHAKRLDTKNPDNRVEVGQQMFSVCWSANAIAFLADYSVHQVILGYGYYRYIQRKRLLKQRTTEEERGDAADNKAPPLLKQSATLMLSRSLGLVFTAVGGAGGTMLLPGWGTLFGSNLGDSLGGAFSEAVSALNK
jgi:hypothetical protein